METEKSNSIGRFCTVMVAFGILFGVLIGGVFSLCVLDNTQYSQPAEKQQLVTIDKKIDENRKEINTIRTRLDTLTIRESFRELSERYNQPRHTKQK